MDELTATQKLENLLVSFNFYSGRQAIDEIAKLVGWDVIKEYVDGKHKTIIINGSLVEWYKSYICCQDLLDLLKEEHLSVTISFPVLGAYGKHISMYDGSGSVLVEDGMIINAYNTGNG